MTEQTIHIEEEFKDAARTATDRVSVAGGDLIKTVQSLLREAAVRRITVQDKNGRTLIEIPLYAGVIGALLIGSWTVLALIAAWFAEVSILIERDVASDDDSPTVVGETVERAAGSMSATVSSAASTASTTIGSAIGGVARGASGLARRAADSLEGHKGQSALSEQDMARGEQAAEAIIAAAAAAEPNQCVALTKAGARCKRTAVVGSDYCGTHQPK